jgi:hypothetical protein
MPALLMVIIAWGLVYTAGQKIGIQKVMENEMQTRPKQEAQYEKLTPEQRAQQVKITGVIYYIAIPLFTLLIWLVMAGLQFGTFKFAAKTDISYSKSLAVVVYARIADGPETFAGHHLCASRRQRRWIYIEQSRCFQSRIHHESNR